MNDSLAQHAHRRLRRPPVHAGDAQCRQRECRAPASRVRPCAVREAECAAQMGRDGTGCDASASMCGELASWFVAAQAAKHGGTDVRSRQRAPISEFRTCRQDSVRRGGSSRIPGLISARRAGESPAGRRAGYGPGNRASPRPGCCRKTEILGARSADRPAASLLAQLEQRAAVSVVDRLLIGRRLRLAVQRQKHLMSEPCRCFGRSPFAASFARGVVHRRFLRASD